MVISTMLAVACGKVELPASLISTQFNLSELFLKLDIRGALHWSCVSAIFTLMFMDMFDSIGTLVACANRAKLVDEKGQIRDLDRLLALNAGATMMGALFGTSTTTAYVESAAGFEQGGRTGFASVVTAVYFLFGIFLIPLIAMVPPYATAPALIMVGFFMIREVARIDFSNMEEGFPAFVIIVMIALSYSISTGLA